MVSEQDIYKVGDIYIYIYKVGYIQTNGIHRADRPQSVPRQSGGHSQNGTLRGEGSPHPGAALRTRSLILGANLSMKMQAVAEHTLQPSARAERTYAHLAFKPESKFIDSEEPSCLRNGTGFQSAPRSETAFPNAKSKNRRAVRQPPHLFIW